MQNHSAHHRFLELAFDFHLAGASLLNTQRKSVLPPLFLFARSIELSLKYLLSGKGLSEEILSKHPYRHSLTNLFNQALRLNSIEINFLSDLEVSALELLSKEYSATHLAYSSADQRLLIPTLSLAEDISTKFVELNNPHEVN